MRCFAIRTTLKRARECITRKDVSVSVNTSRCETSIDSCSAVSASAVVAIKAEAVDIGIPLTFASRQTLYRSSCNTTAINAIRSVTFYGREVYIFVYMK